MASTQLAKLNSVHLALMDFMLQRPEASLREMADYFGYSVSWLSIVTNSDVFRAAFAERRVDIESRIAADIPTKLRGIAAQTLDKLAAKVEEIEDPAFIKETADMVLHRLGYAPSRSAAPAPAQVNVQQNTYILTKDDLQRHQQVILSGVVHTPALPSEPAET